MGAVTTSAARTAAVRPSLQVIILVILPPLFVPIWFHKSSMNTDAETAAGAGIETASASAIPGSGVA